MKINSISIGSSAVGGVLVLALLAFFKESTAFKPDKPDHGHQMITRSVLTSGYSYKGKTVGSFSANLSTGIPVSFSDTAVIDVAQGNATTDWFYNHDHLINGVSVSVVGEFMDETAHCDNDAVAECSLRISSKLNGVIADLKKYAIMSEEGRTSLVGKELIGYARLNLGKSLHTLQDFYAHSDHANRKPDTEVFSNIYVLNLGSSAPFRRGVPGVGLYSGRNYNECAPVSHGGNYVYNDKKSKDSPPTTGYFAPGAETVLGSLYAGGVLDAGSDVEGEARCDHGAYTGVNTINGVNKDDKDPVYGVDIPAVYQNIMRAAHVSASYLAAQHTLRLMSDLMQAIKSYPGITDAQRDIMISGLLGVDQGKPAYGFVVDTTGSMSSIISGVKTQIQKLIDDSVAAGKSGDQKFLLIDYGDPTIGNAFIGSAADVKAKVSALSAGGGGDCPELTQGAVKKAIEAAPEKSALYVFTDASAKDSSLGDEVAKAAVAKKIAVTYVASGSCSPIDPSYYAVAAATGGQVLVTDHTSASVAAAFTSISIEDTGTAFTPVVIERGTLSASKTVDVVVETGAKKLSVLTTLDVGTIEFLSPDGSRVVNGGSVLLTEFLGGKGVKVNNPVAGVWKVVYTVSGAPTAYSIKADVASESSFAEFKFQDNMPSGRLGHESYSPFTGMPPMGNVRYAARLVGGINSPVFEAMTEDGTVLSTFTTSRETDQDYAGAAVLTSTPFRVRVKGIDTSGKAVVRTQAVLYVPSKLLIRALDVPRFVAGGVNKVYLQVSNADSAGSVDISAATTIGLVAAVKPASLTLAAGASAVVEVSVTLPATASADSKKALSIIATKGGASEKVQVQFEVAADSDGDGVPDTEEMGPTGADELYDGNGDGKPDFMQAEVISLHSRSRNAYLTLSIDGPGRFVLATAAQPPADTAGLKFPLDLFDFKIVGLGNGAATKVKMMFPGHLAPNGYHKYGPLPTNKTASWYSFIDDGVTGAKWTGSLVTLSLVDGQRGDDDLTANGEIVDIGGPTDIKLAGVKDSIDAAPPLEDAGGGCTIGRGTKSDASLLLLFLAASGFVVIRGRRKLNESAVPQQNR